MCLPSTYLPNLLIDTVYLLEAAAIALKHPAFEVEVIYTHLPIYY